MAGLTLSKPGRAPLPPVCIRGVHGVCSVRSGRSGRGGIGVGKNADVSTPAHAQTSFPAISASDPGVMKNRKRLHRLHRLTRPVAFVAESVIGFFMEEKVRGKKRGWDRL